MSKKNMLLGVATGKVGDLVFYRAGGEQRTRTRVTPANPRSYNQQVQRSKIAEIVNAYRAMSVLLKETFPNRPTKQSTFNAFSAANMVKAPTLMRSEAKIGIFNPAPFFIAKGSLKTPFDNQAVAANAFTFTCGVIEDAAPTDEPSLFEALHALHPCCVVEGSKMVIVVVNNGVNGMGDTGSIKMIPVNLSSEGDKTLADLGITATKESGTNQLKLSVAVESVTSIAGVVILTPTNEGKWDCNNAQMVLGTGAETKYLMYYSGIGVEAAAESYNAAAPSCLLG